MRIKCFGDVHLNVSNASHSNKTLKSELWNDQWSITSAQIRGGGRGEKYREITNEINQVFIDWKIIQIKNQRTEFF